MSGRLFIPALSFLLAGALTVSAQTTSHPEQKTSVAGGLRLEALIVADSVSPSRRLEVTLRNIGSDVQVDPGAKWSDDEEDIVPQLKISVKRENRRLDVLNKKSFKFVEGKVEPLVVVLRAGQIHKFDLPLKDFLVGVTGANDPNLEEYLRSGDEVRVEFSVGDDIYKLGHYYGQDCLPLHCWTGSIGTSFTVQ